MPLIIILFIIVGTIIIVFILFFIYYFLNPKKIEHIQEYLKQGKTSQAIKLAKSIIARDQRNVDARYLLGQAYLAEDKPELALMEFKSINQIGKFGDICLEIPFRRQIASLFQKYNQVNEALKEYLLLAKLEPYNADHFYNIGILFENRGNDEKSLNYFTKTIQLDERHAAAHYKLGYLLYKQKKYVEAKVELELAIRYDPDNYYAHFYRGRLLKENADFGAALQAFEKAQKSPELKIRALVERGNCYMRMNNLQQAVIELSRAIKLTTEDTSLEALYGRYFLALCYEKMRNLDKAIEQWEYIYSKKPSFQDVAEKLSQYQDLRTDDRVKDYLTSHNEIFVQICSNIVRALRLEIRDIDEITNGCQIVAAEAESKWRNARKMPKLIWFLRVPDMINETTIRHLLEKMKKLNINRGVIFTSSNFSRMALDYAESRPIELYNKEKLKECLYMINMD